MSWNVLLSDSAKHWLRPKGLAIVLIAVLVAPGLTAAWVLTHQDDVAVTGITWEPAEPVLGDTIRFDVHVSNTRDAVGGFNVTLRVGYHEDVFGRTSFRARFNETQHVDGLAGGASRVVSFTWNTTRAGATADSAGSFVAQATIDPDDVIQEIEEKNNDWQEQVRLALPPSDVGSLPGAAPNGTTNGTASFEIVVHQVRLHPEGPVAGQQVNATVTVVNQGPDDLSNATLQVYLGRGEASFQVVGGYLVPQPTQYTLASAQTAMLNLSAGEWTNVTVQFDTPLRVAPYVVQAVLDTRMQGREPTLENNLVETFFQVDRAVTFVPPPPKATAKDFYTDILELLHFRLLIPLVALFFAAGVLERERQEGNLPYLLTRPIPRWALPVSRFIVGGVAAGAALLVGVLATFLLLLGLPQDAPGFFGFPLLFSWLTLLVYAAAFTLLGVVAQRPYVWGLVYVLGVETLIALGRSTEFLTINGEPLLQEWAEYLSLHQLVLKAFAGWDAAAASWTGGGAQTALWILLGIGVAAIALAAGAMRKKEFPDV